MITTLNDLEQTFIAEWNTVPQTFFSDTLWQHETLMSSLLDDSGDHTQY